jgi:hypothetical protein
METGSSVAGQGDPAGEIGAAWSVKERLSILLVDLTHDVSNTEDSTS